MLFEHSVGELEVGGQVGVEARRQHGQRVGGPVEQFVDELGLTVDTAGQRLQRLTAAPALLHRL